MLASNGEILALSLFNSDGLGPISIKNSLLKIHWKDSSDRKISKMISNAFISKYDIHHNIILPTIGMGY